MVRPVQQELLARQGLQGQPVLLGLLGRRGLLVIREILGQQDLLGQPDRQAVKDLLVPRVQLECKAMLAQQDRPDQPEIKV